MGTAPYSVRRAAALLRLPLFKWLRRTLFDRRNPLAPAPAPPDRVDSV